MTNQETFAYKKKSPDNKTELVYGSNFKVLQQKTTKQATVSKFLDFAF